MKSLSRHFTVALVLSTLAVAAPALQAQEFKAGFVNTDRIFREATTAKAAQAKLEQEFSRREKELLDMGNTLKTATEKFERKRPPWPKASAPRASASWWTRTANFSASAVSSRKT